jgi:hypothetical protein
MRALIEDGSHQLHKNVIPANTIAEESTRSLLQMRWQQNHQIKQVRRWQELYVR